MHKPMVRDIEPDPNLDSDKNGIAYTSTLISVNVVKDSQRMVNVDQEDKRGVTNRYPIW